MQKKEVRNSPNWQQLLLIRRERENIECDLNEVCRDVVALLERSLLPAANTGEETVFYCKMKGDYYRYLAEISRNQLHEKYATFLDAYKFAYKHALSTLDPAHPTRLGLALNLAVYYYDIVGSPERACYVAKHAFDEAIAAASDPSFSRQSLEDALMILHLLKDDLLLWSGEIGPEKLLSDD